MDIREIGWESMCWINLAEDMDQLQALLNIILNILE
jgi:hypothetical protein